PGPEGLPIEIYAFTSTTEWAVYENIQSDMVDHILSIVPEFGLRVFQNPTGSDLLRLTAFNDRLLAAQPSVKVFAEHKPTP
ncbi:MAG: hypothetical protein ACR2P1_28770, partial [Pseudomonadales bacterium]